MEASKRCRETSPEDSPDSKRLHTDLLFGILEADDPEAGDRDPASPDLATVMKSLEEEIAMPPKRQVEIGYLLEASDDDLGLPPPPAETAAESFPSELWTVEGDEGFGEIWGFEEEEMMGFGDPAEEVDGDFTGGGDGFFDGGVFDSSELYWKTEWMQAQ